MKGNMIERKENYTESHYEIKIFSDTFECSSGLDSPHFDSFDEAYNYVKENNLGINAEIYEYNDDWKHIHDERFLCVWIARPIGVSLEDLNEEEV